MVDRCQFSIRFLLAATVAVAAGVAVARLDQSFPSTLAVNGSTVVFATASIVTGIHTSGTVRAFWVGTSVVLGLAVVMVAMSLWMVFQAITSNWPNPPQGYGNNRFFWAFWCAAPINGLFAAFIHWLFAPSKPPA